MAIPQFSQSSNPGQVPDWRSDVERDSPQISVYDPDSPDITQALQQADEAINISGAPVEVYIRTKNKDFDEVWDEDPDPTYYSPETMKAVFAPQPIELELTKFGVDAPNKTEIVFSRSQLLGVFGDRLLRSGDVIKLPYNAVAITPSKFRVKNVSEFGNYRYTWLYVKCQVESLTGDITVDPSPRSQQIADYPQ